MPGSAWQMCKRFGGAACQHGLQHQVEAAAPPRSQADWVFDLGMPRMTTGAAVASGDGQAGFDDAFGGHLFAGAARGTVVRGAERLALLRQGLKR